jgi:hypothetical protein
MMIDRPEQEIGMMKIRAKSTRGCKPKSGRLNRLLT